MLRFAAATKAQLRISVCQQCYCCCCCSCCCCWLPSAWLCLNSFYSIRQNSPCCTAQQLFSRSLFPSLIFSFPILSRRPELGTSTFFNLEDAVTFPRALPSSVALVYGQNGSGEEPEKEIWRAKKVSFFSFFYSLFKQIWWLHSTCLLQKKQTSAHFASLHALRSIPSPLSSNCELLFDAFDPQQNMSRQTTSVLLLQYTYYTHSIHRIHCSFQFTAAHHDHKRKHNTTTSASTKFTPHLPHTLPALMLQSEPVRTRRFSHLLFANTFSLFSVLFCPFSQVYIQLAHQLN